MKILNYFIFFSFFKHCRKIYDITGLVPHPELDVEWGNTTHLKNCMGTAIINQYPVSKFFFFFLTQSVRVEMENRIWA